jgi:hypothetical protein
MASLPSKSKRDAANQKQPEKKWEDVIDDDRNEVQHAQGVDDSPSQVLNEFSTTASDWKLRIAFHVLSMILLQLMGAEAARHRKISHSSPFWVCFMLSVCSGSTLVTIHPVTMGWKFARSGSRKDEADIKIDSAANSVHPRSKPI